MGRQAGVAIDELDPRWLSFLDLYIKTSNAYESAVQAGFSESYATTIKSRLPEKVRKSITAALEEKGITSERIAESIDFLLESDEYQAVDKGLTHAIKIRGDYVPEKHIVGHIDLEPSERIKELANMLLVLQSRHEKRSEDD